MSTKPQPRPVALLCTSLGLARRLGCVPFNMGKDGKPIRVEAGDNLLVLAEEPRQWFYWPVLVPKSERGLA